MTVKPHSTWNEISLIVKTNSMNSNSVCGLVYITAIRVQGGSLLSHLKLSKWSVTDFKDMQIYSNKQSITPIEESVLKYDLFSDI